ncbi:MAG TPA: glycerophosphodiester phosphodiesterase [Acidimicrobiales bacterium]|jgi:glycerophosphoryl diester phosphodiesterase|nr:glycerophosphodiester phosphodiesterase [Acidimicrobiales bacterium]
MTAVFAHRGCTEGFTENTLDAFVEARRLGADGVELDVRLTADGALAVHHDAEIPGRGTIAQLEVADLPAHVPLLADVLAVCEGLVVNVEIKNAPQDPGWDAGESVAALAAAAIDEAGWTARVIVSSFQMTTLRAVQAADGRLALGALWGFGTEVETALAQVADAGLAAVHPFVLSVTPELVERSHAMGLAVNVWTVNAPEDLRAMVAAGVDTVITDRLGDALTAAAAGG